MNRRNKYSTEFKEEAVRRAISGTYTLKEVAESLGMSYFVLRQWKKEYMGNPENRKEETNPKKIKESEELRKLRVENQRLKMDNAILKKFAAMLSRDQE